MKLNIGLFLLLIGSLLVFSTCQKNKKDSISANTPNAQIENAFKKQFPQASDVTWTYRSGYSIGSEVAANTRDKYMVASFRLPENKTGNTNQAWYTDEGNCMLAETDIISFSDLPVAVQNAYNTTEYAKEKSTIHNMAYVERKGMIPVYKIEIDRANKSHRDLLFSTNGLLISDRFVDTHHTGSNFEMPVVIPAPITKYLDGNMKGALVEDFDKNYGEYEVDVNYNNKQYQLFFSSVYKFLRSKEQISEAQIPQAAKEKLASRKATWEVVQVTRITYDDNSVIYRVDIRNRKTGDEKDISFKADGKLIG